MKHDDAKWLMDEYMAADRHLGSIARALRDRLPADEARDHLLRVGGVVSELSHAVERVLKEHPDLRPPGMAK